MGGSRLTIWTDEFIRSLVTDAGSLKDGKAIGTPSKWQSFARTDRAAWGLARGSAKEPYKTALDLTDGASKCSCPSRKFPCKHAIGLMFLLAADAVPLTGDAPPAWAAAWIEGREKRAQPKPTAEAKPVDVAAQTKRQRAREAKVEAGIAELRRWLEDLARGGLSDERVKTYQFWDGIAAHMVDAQMSPIAARLRRLGGRPFQRSTDWMQFMAEEIGMIYALTDAFARLDTLPDGLQADVRAALGFPLRNEEIRAAGAVVRDRWRVMGSITEQEDKLLIRRTWLYGEGNGVYALILDFTPQMRAFAAGYPLGAVLDADLIFYPSAYPQRALVKQIYATSRPDPIRAPFTNINHLLDIFADALALNPFLERFPAGIASAWLTTRGIEDDEGRWLHAAYAPSATWMLAVTGGQPAPVFGEWDGVAFRPLMVLTEEGWVGVEGGE
jgi:hypothetical protein